MKIMTIEVDETGKVPYLALQTRASPKGVDRVFCGEHSEWRWIRLPNGGLILGVFPQGDTYLSVTDETGI